MGRGELLIGSTSQKIRGIGRVTALYNNRERTVKKSSPVFLMGSKIAPRTTLSCVFKMRGSRVNSQHNLQRRKLRTRIGRGKDESSVRHEWRGRYEPKSNMIFRLRRKETPQSGDKFFGERPPGPPGSASRNDSESECRGPSTALSAMGSGLAPFVPHSTHRRGINAVPATKATRRPTPRVTPRPPHRAS